MDIVGASRSGAETALKTSEKFRLNYFDNLKVGLTFLVIAHHAGQAYGRTGGYWPVMETARAAFLGPFFTVNRSFFMSLFFFISGLFMVGAFERHGPREFARSRLVRLGIPVLVFMLAFVPLRIFLFHEHIARWDDILFAGHLWYLEHVLLFSLVYALVVWLRRGQRRTNVGDAERRHGPPNLAVMLASLLCIAVVSAIVRFWSPIDRWFNLLGFFRVAFADVPRDLSFFVFGAVAARRDWVRIYPRKAGFAWLSVGILASASYYLWALVPAFHFKFVDHVYGLVYPFWEEIVCFGMCIGLVVFFREFVNHAGRLARFLRANQYSAYFWHPLILVLLQKAALQLAVPPGPKFVLVTVIAVPLVFLWSAFVRRSRIVRKVL